MRVVVTGAEGYLGANLCRLLLDRGHEVTGTGLHRKGHTSLDALGVSCRVEYGDVTDPAFVERVISDSEAEWIFHLAAVSIVRVAQASPARALETNIMGSAAVFRVANRYQRKVVLTSTSEIYGKSDKVPFAEDDDRLLGPTTRSRWSYSTSKAVDEFLALAYHKERGLPVVIVRLFNTVGPRQTGQYGMVIPTFVR